MSRKKVKTPAKPKKPPRKERKPRIKGDAMVDSFHVEQNAANDADLSKDGGQPGTTPVSPGSESVKHNTSSADIPKPQVEIALSRFHVEYDPAFCDALIDHMAQGYSFESFAAKLPPVINGNVALTRRTTGKTLDDWAKRHLDFGVAKQIGIEASRYFWETMGTLGAHGKLKGFNNITWLFNMKNRFRKEWKDRHELNMKGHDNSGQATQKAVFLIPANTREKPPERTVTETKKAEGDDDRD